MPLDMWTGVILVTATVLVTLQWSEALTIGKSEKAVREFVDIDGGTYFIDTAVGYHRDEAQSLCRSLNMSLVAFENDDKWYAVNRWLGNNDLGTHWFWTDALRDEGSTVWYWESTGAAVPEDGFYWGLGQPSMNEVLVRACVDFSYRYGGWDDDQCTNFFWDVICQ